MILDKHNMFSEDQLVTSSAGSTNVIDLGANDSKAPNPCEYGDMELFAQVTTTFTGATTMSVALQTDSDEAFGSPQTIYTSAAIAEASLVAGYRFKIGKVPHGLERYVRLYYTVDGTHGAGAISAGLVLQAQSNGIV